MTNPNKQYDLMKAFQIKSSDVFDIPKEFKKISLNVPQHGGSGSVPSIDDEIDLERGHIGQVHHIKSGNVYIRFPNKPTRKFKLSLNNFDVGSIVSPDTLFMLDELEDIQNINYSIMVLNGKLIQIVYKS